MTPEEQGVMLGKYAVYLILIVLGIWSGKEIKEMIQKRFKKSGKE